MKDKEFVIFDPAVSPSQDWELYKRLYIDPYPEKQIILQNILELKLIKDINNIN
jgi:hypothetical protein